MKLLRVTPIPWKRADGTTWFKTQVVYLDDDGVTRTRILDGKVPASEALERMR